MANYNLTNKALEDLNDIWEFTCKKWSEEQADKYYGMLLNRCEDLGTNPGLGKSYKKITIDLFGLVVVSHIIFYRKIENQPIEITRILHGSVDVKNRISE